MGSMLFPTMSSHVIPTRVFGVRAGQDAVVQESSWMTSFMGLSSIFAVLGLISQSYMGSSLKLLVLGSLVEAGRRLCWWLIERFRIRGSLKSIAFHATMP
jgi:hypothetical protein